LNISTVWLVLFIYFRSVNYNYSLIYICMSIAMYVRLYADLNYFLAVCMYVCMCKNHFLESDRYALSSVSLRTVTSIGENAFYGKYPDLLFVW